MPRVTIALAFMCLMLSMDLITLVHAGNDDDTAPLVVRTDRMGTLHQRRGANAHTSGRNGDAAFHLAMAGPSVEMIQRFHRYKKLDSVFFLLIITIGGIPLMTLVWDFILMIYDGNRSYAAMKAYSEHVRYIVLWISIVGMILWAIHMFLLLRMRRMIPGNFAYIAKKDSQYYIPLQTSIGCGMLAVLIAHACMLA